MSDKLPPYLPMTLDHQRAILRGDKYTTLRRKPFAPGVYRLLSASRCTLAWVRITRVYAATLHWPNTKTLAADGGLSIALSEGYATVAEFEAAVRKIAGGAAFIAGRSSYYLHDLDVEEDVRSGRMIAQMLKEEAVAQGVNDG